LRFFHAAPRLEHKVAQSPPRLGLLLRHPALVPEMESTQMTRYYRAALTTALLAGLSLPAFAQAPAPTPMTPPAATAPAAPGSEAATPMSSKDTPPADKATTPDDKSAAPNTDEAKTGKTVKHHVRHHRHHVATAKPATPPADATTPPPAQK
jgi:hypothetical protein